MTAWTRGAWAAMLGALLTTSVHAEKITIVAIGDSTTAGTPFFASPVEAPPDGKGDPEGQYSYWMMRRHPEWTVINQGVDGERTDQVRLRLDDALNSQPRYVVILAGVNDVYQGTSLQAAADNLAAMYKEAEDKGVLPVAATILPFNTATPKQQEAIKRLNVFIRNVADHRNIPLAELHNAVADPDNANALNGSPDGMHPDVGGYRKMGEVVAKVIEQMEKSHPHR